MRLGELLLKKGVITPEQLKAALHEQKRYGGRLGTNLLQLGYVSVDTIALALSVQRGFPAAQRSHVAKIDPRVIARFPERLVSQHRVIPIGYTGHKPPRVVVACADPETIPVDELTFAAGNRLELWIAPEALIQACMERYFGATAQTERYLSINMEAQDDASSYGSLQITSAPQQPEPPPPPPPPPPASKAVVPVTPVETKRASRSRVLSPPPPPPTQQAVTFLEPPPPPPLAQTPPPPSPLPQAFPPTTPTLPLPPPIVSEVEPEVEAPPPIAPSNLPPPDDDWDLADPIEPPDAEFHHPVTAPPEALRPVIDRAQASMLIEMATSKEAIGRTLEDWLRSSFGCGLVLVIKGDMAIGWKGFFPDAEDLIEAVAVSLGKPSMFSAAYDSHEPFLGPPSAEGAKIHERLWKLLRCAPPAEALVCPVAMGKRTINLIYAHMEDGSALPESLVEDAKALAKETASAYARLIAKEKKR